MSAMGDARMPTHNEFPRPALYGAAAIVVLTMVAAGVGRLTGSYHIVPDPAAPVAERDLRFEDRADGGVTVRDAKDGHEVTVLAPGTNGFVRATVRGLASQRRREDKGEETPFHLTAWADGRLTLIDPATGRRLDLEAFGRTNEGAFAAMLDIPATLRGGAAP